MTDEPIVPVARGRTKPFILFRIAQWFVTGFLALILLIIALEVRKLSAPNAPVMQFWMTLPLLVAITVLHTPPIFFRIPLVGKWAAYVGVVVAVSAFGNLAGQINEAYVRTPEGAKEAADNAASKVIADKKATEEKAAEVARLKAEQEVTAREAEDRKLANIEAKKPVVCKILVDQMIEQSKSDNITIIEVNNVVPNSFMDETHPISCSGDAITSAGNMQVEFGLEHTPQGKDLLTYRLR